MIGIIDYGLGNISAFKNIYKKLDIPTLVINSEEQIDDKVDRFILPGVGSFDWAINLLNNSGLRDKLEYMVLKRKYPILGVCVGMQLLFDSSEEGDAKGLGWIPGEVRKLNAEAGEMIIRLPHMGWNKIQANSDAVLFDGINSDAEFYFLHSYSVVPKDEAATIACTEYHNKFTSSVQSANVFGTQFHPEKSHANGIRVLANFSRLKID